MKFNHILSGLALTAAVLAAGCQKSLEYSDVVYFTGTENSNITNMYVDGPSSMGVTVTSSCKMAADVRSMPRPSMPITPCTARTTGCCPPAATGSPTTQ